MLLSEKYKLSRNENDIFHLMNVTQGSNNAHVLNCLIEEDYLRRVTGFQRISNMSEIDIDVFCDGERQHMKEGLVLVVSTFVGPCISVIVIVFCC